MTFEELVAPRNPERFWAETWERSADHISGRPANHLADVATGEEIIELLFGSDGLPAEAVKFYRGSERAPHDSGNGIVPAAKLRELYGRGFTILVESADRFLPRLASTLAALEDRFKAKCLAHLVASPAGAEGLAPHSDAYGLFALQIAGAKTWSLYEDGPRNTVNHGTDRHHLIGAVPTSLVPMAPGDLLYLPRGTIHSAASGDQGSIHLALALIPPRGADALALLCRAAEEDPFFRGYAPYGILESAGSRSDYAAEFRARLEALAAETDIFELLDRRRAERAAFEKREGRAAPRLAGHGPTPED
ncbi:MAG TPA: cupin domain-containing protein [Allosphingosinicella sp.]